MRKKQIQGLDLVAVSLALVIVLIGAVSYLVFISDEAFKSSPNEVEPQPPMPAIPPYSDVQTLTGEEKSKAIELAINEPGVKKWLDEGYEVYEVVPLPLPPLPPHSMGYDTRPCIVYILTEERELPWVLGVTLKVSVDVIQEKVHGFDFNLNLASLTEEQKEEVLRIALADPEVLKVISDEEYEIRSVGLGYWKSCHEGECSFHVYPHVNIIVNPHARFPEVITKVDIYVDLESKEVVKINSIPKQPPPPPPSKESPYEIPLISSFKQINLYENGEVQSLNELEGIAGVLVSTLSKLNLQATCVFSEEGVQYIKRNHKVVGIVFKEPLDITISQRVEPEEGYHIPVDEKGYRILEKVKTAIFLLEDVKGGGGLEAHILVGSEREKKDERCSWKVTKEDKENYKELGPIWSMIAGYEFDEERGCIPVGGSKYIKDVVPFKTKEECELACGRMRSCWAIEKGDEGLDKGWIEEINEIISTEEYLPIHCCEECLEAFSGCPIAVGPEALMCGEFSSGYNMSEECREYFKEHPASVSKCESLLKVQSEAQNIIIDYNMGGLTKVHIENNKIDYTYSKLREGETGGTFIGAYAQFEESAQISEEEIKSLLKIFEENDFFNLKEEYGNVSQYDRYYSHSIRLKTNQKDKTVLFKDTPWTEEAPPEFISIERAIRQLATEKFNRKG